MTQLDWGSGQSAGGAGLRSWGGFWGEWVTPGIISLQRLPIASAMRS